MTDVYPPFRMDMGGEEPSEAAATDAILPRPLPGLS